MSTQPLSFTVAFDDADGEGIVFFGNYFRLAHRALEQFLPTLGIPWADWFNNPEFGAPLRHVEADYLRPLKPGETFEVVIQVEEIGESSVRFGYTFSSQGQPVANLKTVHVFVQREPLKKIPLPDSFRALLSKTKKEF